MPSPKIFTDTSRLQVLQDAKAEESVALKGLVHGPDTLTPPPPTHPQNVDFVLHWKEQQRLERSLPGNEYLSVFPIDSMKVKVA